MFASLYCSRKAVRLRLSFSIEKEKKKPIELSFFSFLFMTYREDRKDRAPAAIMNQEVEETS